MSIQGLLIPIITTNDDRGVKKAEKSFLGLESAASKLGKTIAAAFTVTAAYNFAKSSVEAFKQEQVVIGQLSNSLSNMGVSFKDVQPVLQKTTDQFVELGFQNEDTLLAFNKMAVGLQNPAKALDLLSTTADLARYNQISFADAADLVTKASQGSAKGFKNLGLSLDKNLSPTDAFNKLMLQTKDRLHGTAEAFGKTLAGGLDRASAKMDDAKQKLGEKLAPAVIALANAVTKYLVPVINWVSQNIGLLSLMAAGLAAVAVSMNYVAIAAKVMSLSLMSNPIWAAVAAVAALIAGLSALKKMEDNDPNVLTYGKGVASGTAGIGKQFDPNAPHPILGEGKAVAQKTIDAVQKAYEKSHAAITKTKLTEEQKYQAALKKLQEQSAALEKKNAAQIIADKTKQLALDKAAAVLKTSQKIFDLNAIELAAAAQGKLTDQERKRVELKQLQLELQDAIDNKDETLAIKLAAQIQAGMAGITGLTSSLAQVKTSDNPLASLLADLESGKKTLDEMVAAFNILKGGSALASISASHTASLPELQSIAGAKVETSLSQLVNGLDYTARGGMSVGSGAGQIPMVVNVQIGNQAVNDVVVTATQNSSASGVPLNYGRLNSNVLGNL